jgi:hypothetical protein
MPWVIINSATFAKHELNSRMDTVPEYYFSKHEWDRLGCGPLPPERDKDLPENQEKIRQSLESLQRWLKDGTGKIS